MLERQVLDARKTVVVEATREHGESASNLILGTRNRVVVLVNQGTASASEIVAGALMDYDRAHVIGEKTFGKGSVQELVSITGDTSLKVTIAHWLTPLGNSISEGGITPDIEVKLTPEDVAEGRDPQLERAEAIYRRSERPRRGTSPAQPRLPGQPCVSASRP